MAKLLFTWELGSKLGHLSNLYIPIVTSLKAGHTVYLASREKENLKRIFGDLQITYLQAPYKQSISISNSSMYLSYTHLLKYQAFGNTLELINLISMWRKIYNDIKPDMVFYEHSPTALLASTSYSFKKIMVGTGFFIPLVNKDANVPFCVFPTTVIDNNMRNVLMNADMELLTNINTSLKLLNIKEINGISDIFSQVNDSLYVTLPCIDHFMERKNVTYLGTSSSINHTKPIWPDSNGIKVYCYLQNMPSLEILIKDLIKLNVCAIICIFDLPEELKIKYTCSNISFMNKPIDLEEVVKEAKLIVNNSNHGTVANFILHGIPQLLIPRYQEQLLMAIRLEKQGAALIAYQDSKSYKDRLEALLTNNKYTTKAVELENSNLKYKVNGIAKYIVNNIL